MNACKKQIIEFARSNQRVNAKDLATAFGMWKIQSELTPRANVSLTPENFLILTP